MSLVNQLISQANLGRMLSDGEVSHYSPTEIREAIQQLVANDNNDLAYALGDAGISLYPNNEDMLAINGLLAIMPPSAYWLIPSVLGNSTHSTAST